MIRTLKGEQAELSRGHLPETRDKAQCQGGLGHSDLSWKGPGGSGRSSEVRARLRRVKHIDSRPQARETQGRAAGGKVMIVNCHGENQASSHIKDGFWRKGLYSASKNLSTREKFNPFSTGKSFK